MPSHWLIDVKIAGSWYYWSTWYITPLRLPFDLEWRATPALFR